jgi:hypothetical protein
MRELGRRGLAAREWVFRCVCVCMRVRVCSPVQSCSLAFLLARSFTKSLFQSIALPVAVLARALFARVGRAGDLPRELTCSTCANMQDSQNGASLPCSTCQCRGGDADTEKHAPMLAAGAGVRPLASTRSVCDDMVLQQRLKSPVARRENRTRKTMRHLRNTPGRSLCQAVPATVATG